MSIAVFPGDGIGPEVTAEAVAVLERWRCRATACGSTFERDGSVAARSTPPAMPLPADELAPGAARATRCCSAPSADRSGTTRRPPSAPSRRCSGCARRSASSPTCGRSGRVPALLDAVDRSSAEVLDGVDLVVVRELTGGIYFGQPSERRTGAAGREAVDTCVYTEDEIARVLHAAFALARQRRKQVTSVDKANILSTSRLWREVATRGGARSIRTSRTEDVLVDAMAMHLIRRPRDFDVIVTENLFGDILTDEASMLAGSMGMLPSASLGRRTGARRALPRSLRADPRQRPRHRRTGPRQSAGGDPLGGDALSLLARRRRPPRTRSSARSPRCSPTGARTADLAPAGRASDRLPRDGPARARAAGSLDGDHRRAARGRGRGVERPGLRDRRHPPVARISCPRSDAFSARSGRRAGRSRSRERAGS